MYICESSQFSRVNFPYTISLSKKSVTLTVEHLVHDFLRWNSYFQNTPPLLIITICSVILVRVGGFGNKLNQIHPVNSNAFIM